MSKAGNDNDNKDFKISDRIIPHNELAETEPKMTFEEIIKTLSRLQDELYARGLEDSAALLHRALGKLTICTLNAVIAKKMEAKPKSEAA